MPEEETTTNDLYRELITVQERWREETKSIISDYSLAIDNLNTVKKRFDLFSRVMFFLVTITLIFCLSVLIYLGKIKICTIDYMELSVATNNCAD